MTRLFTVKAKDNEELNERINEGLDKLGLKKDEWYNVSISGQNMGCHLEAVVYVDEVGERKK
jgi:hypothetical protein